jgi:hypothetical protein
VLTIAQNMSLIHIFSAKGHLYRPSNPSLPNPNAPHHKPTSSGNGGTQQAATQNYFENRQSQFGLPSNYQPMGQQVDDLNNLPLFKIDPKSTVSKSVIKIDTNFDIVPEDQINQLKLDDYKPPVDMGFDNSVT